MMGTSTPKESGARTLIDFLPVRARFYDGERCAKVGLLKPAVKASFVVSFNAFSNDLRVWTARCTTQSNQASASAAGQSPALYIQHTAATSQHIDLSQNLRSGPQCGRHQRSDNGECLLVEFARQGIGVVAFIQIEGGPWLAIEVAVTVLGVVLLLKLS